MTDTFIQSLNKIAEKWQKIWFEQKVFEPDYGEGEKFFFTVAYPYTNAPMHIGHSRTYTLGDIFVRFKRLQGHNVLWPMAWHMTGTPVLSVASKIKACEPKTRHLYKEYIEIYESNKERIDEILSSFVEPQKIASFFADRISQDFRRMGYSIDYSRQFTTGDSEYNQFVSWQFQKLYDLGYIVQDNYPILYCSFDENAVGEDDISGGDESKIEVTEMTMVKYPLKSGDFLVIATLRPETIYGVTNLWIAPDTMYQRVRVDSEIWIISKPAVIKLQQQGHSTEVIEEVPGQSLVHSFVRHPLTGERLPVLPAIFIDETFGTGLVHAVPAHAIYDYLGIIAYENTNNVKQEIGQAISLIQTVDSDNYSKFPAQQLVEQYKLIGFDDTETIEKLTSELYSNEFYHGTITDGIPDIGGMTAMDARTKIIDILKRTNQADILYEVSQTAYCRCGTKISVAILEGQYFLNYGDPDWKKHARSSLDKMSIYPSKYRILFKNTFDWLDKRPCARRRGIGTSFPFTDEHWIIEPLSDSTIYMAFYTIIKQIRQHSITVSQLVPEFFDFVFLGHGNPDVIATSIGIASEVLQSIQSEFKYWYPNDMRHTAVNHISNHLSFAIFHHAAIFDANQSIQAMSVNEMLLMNGEKMGKSKGNVVPITDIPKTYSVDLTRLYMATSTTADKTIDFREDRIQELQKQLQIFVDMITELINPGTIKSSDTGTIDRNEEEIAIIHFYDYIRSASDAIEKMEIREYGNIVFFKILRMMQRLRAVRSTSFIKVGGTIIKEWLQMISPIIPHIAEEFWEMMGDKNLISISTIRSPDQLFYQSHEYDQSKIREWQYIERLIADINHITRQNHGTDICELYVYPSAAWKYDMYHQIVQLFSDGDFDFGKCMQHFGKLKEYQSKMGVVKSEIQFLVKNFQFLKEIPDSIDSEIQYLEHYRDYVEAVFKADLIVVTAPDMENDPMNKAKFARPLRPAIYVAN